jgi:hypothetical protein
MTFKIFQGDEQDANLLTSAPVGTVLIDANNPNQPISVPHKLEFGDKPSTLPKESADSVVVFINEEKGRDLIVKFEGQVDKRPAAAVPRTQQVTIGTPGPGYWRVTADSQNIDESLLDAAFVATIPKGWQSGVSAKFKLSMCGLDSFIVTYRPGQDAKQQRHLIVTVRKRLKCHLFEMLASAAKNSVATFDRYRNVLPDAQTFFSDHFGIDLVFPSGPTLTPEGTTSLVNARSNAQLYTMIPAAHSAGRPQRDLWFNVVASIKGDLLGVGGNSLVSLNSKQLDQILQDHEKWVTSWEQFDKTRDGALPETWVKQSFHPPLVGDEREIALKLARHTITPAQYVQKTMFTILLHEIGHALGLVPANEEAGGNRQSGWKDNAYKGHCSKETCVMFHEAEDASLGFSIRLGDVMPFDHSMSFMHMEACTLYLRACDLSDIRHFSL